MLTSVKTLPSFVAWMVYASTRMEAMIVCVPMDKNQTRGTSAVKVGSHVEPVWKPRSDNCIWFQWIFFFHISQTCDNNNVSWTWKARRLPIRFVRASFQRTWRELTVVAPGWVWRTALSVECAPREKQVRFNIKILLTDLCICPMVHVRRI